MTLASAPKFGRIALTLTAAALAACGDGSADSEPGTGAGKVLIAYEVYGADDSTTYVQLLDDLDSPEPNPQQAIEFAGGRATVRAYNGWVFVAPPNSDVIERYSVSADGRLTKDDRVSFADYGFTDLYIDEWGNTFISPEKAYLFNAAEGEFVVWNPDTMEIEGTVDQGGLDLVRDGWSLDSSPAVVRDGRLFRAFYWNNWDNFEWSEQVVLAVYDTETDELISKDEDTRCPSLGNRVDQDEQGNLYFSNWIWNVGATLVHDAPESCVLRVNAGEERFDPDWSLKYSERAAGMQGALFTYLGDGEALMSVFHDDQVEIDEETDGSELVSTENWELWTTELDSEQAAPLDGVPWNSGAFAAHVGERTLVFVAGDDWGATHIYEIEDGKAKHNFDVPGWCYQLFEID